MGEVPVAVEKSRQVSFTWSRQALGVYSVEENNAMTEITRNGLASKTSGEPLPMRADAEALHGTFPNARREEPRSREKSQGLGRIHAPDDYRKSQHCFRGQVVRTLPFRMKQPIFGLAGGLTRQACAAVANFGGEVNITVDGIKCA